MEVAAQTRPRIFVSHSSKDNEFGVRLVQDLRRTLGDDDAVWYDSHGGLFAGDAWFKVITKELIARPVFIVILSPDALASNWVQDEISIAWNQKNTAAGKLIIPILYRDCKVPEHLNTLQMISFLSPESYEHAFQQLCEALFRKPKPSLTWPELCNCCKHITEKMSSLRRHQDLDKLYVQRKNVHDQFMRFLADPETRCFVLLGKSGAGKSSFLLSLAEEMQPEEGQSADDLKRIMLLYDGGLLGDTPFMKAVNQDFSRELGRRVEDIWQEIARIDGIDRHLVLLCIDAVNESERATEIVKQVNTLIRNDWPWLKVLLISRPESWRIIRQDILSTLPDALYYRGEENIAAEERFNYSAQMQPFSLEELPQAYAKYQQEYQIQTPYEELSPRIREIISDPFNLWLVAKNHRSKKIPSNLKVSELVGQYLIALIKEGKLQEGDWRFLEDKLIPLMTKDDHTFSNTITAADLKAAGSSVYNTVYNDQLANGQRANAPFLRLCDADILMLQEQGTIKFTHERFYEHFVGERIAFLSKTQPDRYTFFLKLIEEITGKQATTSKKKIPGKPFLWGAVRNALVKEARQPESEAVLKLCQTAELQVKEMMVNVLITLGQDFQEQAEELLRELVPEEKKASEWQKIRQVVKKSAKGSDIASRNAGRIAIEVASTLGITWALHRAALQEDQSLRTAAVLYSYYLWQHDRAAGFAVLEYIAEKATSGTLPNFVAFESVFGLSMLIFCDHFEDEEVLSKLQDIWRGMIAKLFHIHEGSSPLKGMVRDFARERIISFVITVVFGLFRQLPPSYSMLSYPALEAFFQLGPDKKQLYRNLVQYLDVKGEEEGTYSREQMERDYLAVLHIDNVFMSFTTLMGLVAHACSAPQDFLPFLKLLFEEAKKDVTTYPYLTVIANVAMNVLHRDPMNDEMFDFFVYVIEILQDAYTQHPETYHSRMNEAPQAAALAPYILTQYRRAQNRQAETLRTRLLESRIQAALSEEKSEKKLKFFEFLLTSELPQVGIENQEPRAALAVLEMFFTSNDKDITPMIQAFLSRLRIYYPDEVDAFLMEQQASDEFRLQVRTHEPVEKIGDLVGKRAWYFARDKVLLGPPELRSQFVGLFEKAAEYKHLKTWIDYMIRYLVNLIYGGEALRPSK